MIKNNIIYFGYGDILVRGTNGKVILTEIEPPKEIGTTPNKDTYKELQKVILCADYILLRDINRIENKEIERFSIGKYILDFSNFNSKSIEVLKRHTNRAIGLELFILAC